jgi:hypothetical protein
LETSKQPSNFRGGTKKSSQAALRAQTRADRLELKLKNAVAQLDQKNADAVSEYVAELKRQLQHEREQAAEAFEERIVAVRNEKLTLYHLQQQMAQDQALLARIRAHSTECLLLQQELSSKNLTIAKLESADKLNQLRIHGLEKECSRLQERLRTEHLRHGSEITGLRGQLLEVEQKVLNMLSYGAEADAMGSNFQTLTDANAALKQQHVSLSIVSKENAQLREKVVRLSSRVQDLERCLMAQNASSLSGEDSGQQHFWRVPKECSAQMADLQAQVWELRARERSTAANCEQLQSALDVTHETLRRAHQRDEACARIVAKAVAALTIDYPGVFQACAELAREKCQGVQSTPIQEGYYTLAAYACQMRLAPQEQSA